MTGAIDITPRQRKTLLELLKRYLPGTAVWVYGSRVKWTSRPESDLDMVVFSSPDQKRQVSDLKEALEESNLPFRVDLFIWDEVPEQFRRNIEAGHVVFQERQERVVEGEWRQSTWGEELSLEYGKALRDYKDTEGPYRVYGSNGPVGWTSKPLAAGPGVILGRKGACRGIEYSEEPFFVIDTAYYVKPKTNLHMRWLYYAIKYYKLGEINDGSPIPSTTRAAVYVRDFQVPPFEDQRAIAHILGSLDDKIELNRQMNRTLEQMAQAIFKSWFIDFDPVRVRRGDPLWSPSKRAGTGACPYMTSEILDLFPDSFEDSELGEIPKGWEIKPIGEAVRCVGGSTPSTKKAEYWNGGTNPFVTPKDMSSLACSVILDTERHITDLGVEKISSGQLPVGTVLLSSRAPIGYLAINEVPVSVNQGIIAMICDGPLPNHYVFQWTITNMDVIKSNAGGTTFAEISKKNFRPILAVIPKPEVLAAFVSHVAPLHQQIVENAVSTQSLIRSRDTLLPKLISGELRVPDTEKFMEAAGL